MILEKCLKEEVRDVKGNEVQGVLFKIYNMFRNYLYEVSHRQLAWQIHLAYREEMNDIKTNFK